MRILHGAIKGRVKRADFQVAALMEKIEYGISWEAAMRRWGISRVSVKAIIRSEMLRMEAVKRREKGSAYHEWYENRII